MPTISSLNVSPRPRSFGALALFCAVIFGCGGSSAVSAGPYIPPLAITISPTSAKLAAGESTTFTANPTGGEAIRLFVDWSIQEGEAGGSFTILPDDRNANLSVKYTAPANGGGPYHLVASIHGFPQVKAVATIN